MATKPVLSTELLPVFNLGKHHPTRLSVDSSSPSKPPKPLLIFKPAEQGTYPVILFFHGFCLHNDYYTDLLKHICSHGFIIVAPELWNIISPTKEVGYAAKVADWLASGLPSVLPGNVKANLVKVALVGHSKGGKTAFALALGVEDIKTTQTFCALVGIDPVAGPRKGWEMDPKFLTHKPCSFNLSVPVTVIGTGLSAEHSFFGFSCSPEGLNHEEFFNECKPPCAHFVAKDYGHLDVLDDDDPRGLFGKLLNWVCGSCGGHRDLMRSSVGGIIVAFLNYYFEGEEEDFTTIVNKRDVAPVQLTEVEFKTEGCI